MEIADIINEKNKLHFEKFVNQSEKAYAEALSWIDTTTADYWRHFRQYEIVEHLSDKSVAKWLTVGDGKWGLDSIRLQNKGIKNVLPTDISEYLLQLSKEKGFIKDYSIQNAEKMSFEDNSFDYVFTKEAIHHFPRPYIAIYEMLRVARKGVIIVDGNEYSEINSPAYYEPYPNLNFVYQLSLRDFIKIALGLNYPMIVFKGFNNIYIQGGEFEVADVKKSKIFKKMVKFIKKADKKCLKGQKTYSSIMIGIFKEKLDDISIRNYINNGYHVLNLPSNPNLTANPPSELTVIDIIFSSYNFNGYASNNIRSVIRSSIRAILGKIRSIFKNREFR